MLIYVAELTGGRFTRGIENYKAISYNNESKSGVSQAPPLPSPVRHLSGGASVMPEHTFKVDISSHVRLAKEMQAGKAAEYLVCADLILQGYAAFLSDQGMPYDVVIDTGGRLLRVQVKSTAGAIVLQGRLVYAFGTRRSARVGPLAQRVGRAMGMNEVDAYAFVVLDTREIAYLPVSAMLSRDGASLIQTIHFRSRRLAVTGRSHHPLTHRRAMRQIEDYPTFPDISVFADLKGEE